MPEPERRDLTVVDRDLVIARVIWKHELRAGQTVHAEDALRRLDVLLEERSALTPDTTGVV